LHLTENQIITWHNDEETGATRDERVLHIFPETSEVWVIDAKAKDAIPVTHTFEELEEAIDEGTAVPLEGDCYAPRRLTETDLESKKLRKFQQRRDKAFKILEPLITGEKELRMLYDQDRSALITERAEEIKSWPKKERVTKKIIYIYYRRYLQGGRVPNAVLPRYNNCGARRDKPRNIKKKLGRPSRITRNTRKGADGKPTQVTGANMRPDWLEKIKLGGKLFYEHRLKPSWAGAYMKTLQRFFIKDKVIENGVVIKIITPDANKGEIFTKGQFRYHYLLHRDPKKATLKRSGPKKYNTRHREIRGKCTARGPGFRYLVDATIADIYLISRYGAHLLVGRPVIWVMIDVYSRMITGLCVRFEGEGWLGLRLALQNTVENKVAFCAKYEITITEDLWPARDRPVGIGGDRGPLISKSIERFIRQFRVDVSNTPPYRPDWKGIVEKIFDEMNIRVFNWLPGAVAPDRDPSDPDYRLAAVFDIEELTAMMIEAALHHNNECLVSDDLEIDPDFLTEDLEPYPTQLYTWGSKRRPGGLRKCDFDAVRCSLLSEGYASVSKGQIRFRHKKSPKPLIYKCDQLSDEGLLLRNTGKKGANFNVYFDERWADEIYLVRQAGGELLTCQLRDKDSLHKNRDWAEVIQYKNQNQLQFDKSRPHEVQAQANFNRQMMKRAADAKRRAKEERARLAPDQSKAAFLKNVRANRQNEIARMHEEEAAQLRSGSGQDATKSASEGRSQAPSGRRHPRTPRIPNIAELRKERMGR
jgi:hypothetical protein